MLLYPRFTASVSLGDAASDLLESAGVHRLFGTDLHATATYLDSYLHNQAWFFIIYKQENSDEAQHEILFPLSSLGFSTYELWRLEFQRRSIGAADRRVKLSGRWAGNTRQFLKTFWFPFRSLSNERRKTQSGRRTLWLVSAGPAASR